MAGLSILWAFLCKMNMQQNIWQPAKMFTQNTFFQFMVRSRNHHPGSFTQFFHLPNPPPRVSHPSTAILCPSTRYRNSFIDVDDEEEMAGPKVLMMSFLLHPGKLTWNLKTTPWKRRFLLETIIFRFHVNFRGSSWSFFFVWAGGKAQVAHVFF